MTTENFLKIMKNTCFLSVLAIAVIALSGCSTPESRIARNPEVFAQLTPQQQLLVKAGQVGVGFDMAAVKLALGDPDRITVRTDSRGQMQTWHYVETAYYDGGFIYAGGFWGGRGYRSRYGFGAGFNDPALPVTVMRTFDHFRIDFVNNKVVGISEEVYR
jgi:outer membrane protein assembly factor BamE (lipoprotein component of BamABCDE complex)